MSVTLGLLVTLEAAQGKEAELEKFLQGGLNLVEQEPETITWYAARLGPSTFAIFDSFETEAGRQAHVKGQVAAALGQIADSLLAAPPDIQTVEILAAKSNDGHTAEAPAGNGTPR